MKKLLQIAGVVFVIMGVIWAMSRALTVIHREAVIHREQYQRWHNKPTNSPEGGIETWEDANQAKYTEPTIVITHACEPVIGCETTSEYAWVPHFSGYKPIVCIRVAAKRIVQCFYREDDGTTEVHNILLRGEHI